MPALRWIVPALLLAVACGAAELADPAAIPWSKIEEWAFGKSEANPFLAPAKPAPAPVPPVPAPEPPKPEPLEKPVKPLPPDKRPRDPKECDELKRKIPAVLNEALKWYENRRDFRGAWDACYKLEEYNKAMEYLGKIVLDPKRGALERENPVTNEQVWRTGVMTTPRTDQQILDREFGKWEAKLPRNDGDANWKAWFQVTKDYFQHSAKLAAEITALELKGETDPKALWDLCDRFQNDRPQANIHYLCELYRLREWHPDFKDVASGEVQWRLGDRAQFIRFHEEAAREYGKLIEVHPHHYQVKLGEALWRQADSLLEFGKQKPRNLAYDTWGEARTLFQQFQTKYPKHGNNALKPAGDPNANKSEAMLRLEWIANNMKGR